jgi:hypothetical protein
MGMRVCPSLQHQVHRVSVVRAVLLVYKTRKCEFLPYLVSMCTFHTTLYISSIFNRIWRQNLIVLFAPHSGVLYDQSSNPANISNYSKNGGKWTNSNFSKCCHQVYPDVRNGGYDHLKTLRRIATASRSFLSDLDPIIDLETGKTKAAEADMVARLLGYEWAHLQ